jgi:ribonuclease HI
MADVAKVKLALGRAKYISKIDLKAGFFNVPLAQDSRRYTAFSCAAGRFYWNRMTMGMCNAPAHFQWVMEDVLLGEEAGRKLPASILLDDVTVFEDDVERNVVDAAEAIERLCRAGAMVGLYKGIIGAEEEEFLGETWSSGGIFRPPHGKVQALMQMGDEAIAAMPRAKLYGMLSYWRSFVPDFSARTHALKKLLSQDAGDWTAVHAEEVRHVL